MGEVNSTFLCAADFHTADAGGGEVLGKGGGGAETANPLSFSRTFSCSS